MNEPVFVLLAVPSYFGSNRCGPRGGCNADIHGPNRFAGTLVAGSGYSCYSDGVICA